MGSKAAIISAPASWVIRVISSASSRQPKKVGVLQQHTRRLVIQHRTEFVRIHHAPRCRYGDDLSGQAFKVSGNRLAVLRMQAGRKNDLRSSLYPQRVP